MEPGAVADDVVAAAAAQDAAAFGVSEGRQDPRRVLVCDDTETIRRLIRLNLELEGFEVAEAADGGEAVALLNDHDQPLPHVISMDAQMSPHDGWFVISHIRATARLRTIPVVLVTASVQQHDRKQAEAAGFDAFVAKPFDPDELVALVEQFATHGRPTGGRLGVPNPPVAHLQSPE